MAAFVGRAEPLRRLTAAYESAAPSGGSRSSWAGLVLVTGQAGIGKTALLTRFTGKVAADGATVVWGTCWDGEQAPAWWPWTQALRSLLDQRRGLGGLTPPELAAILPDPTDHASAVTPAATGRVRVLDAAGQLLRRAAAETPLVVVLDDLHRADRSTVDLLSFLAHEPRPGALMLVGAYRPFEASPGVADTLADLAATAELVPLAGLSAGEVADLMRAVAPRAAADQWAPLVHERSGGHPFYARELCRVLAVGGTVTEVPSAVREVIGRRLARLSDGCSALLDAAAVAGNEVVPRLLVEVVGVDAARVAALVAEATAAGILTTTAGDIGSTTRFVHDLYRETVYTSLAPERRVDLHHRAATALLRRHEQGERVFPVELAYHFTVAVPAAGPEPALTWAHSAARADSARFAFAEAAGHLSRLRSTASASARPLTDADQVGLLATEADLRLRSGDAALARTLLDTAWTLATRIGQADLLGTVALGLDRLDARFAMPRADLVAVLDTAREALKGTGTTTEAKVTAALARQLQHSVPADRPRARPLADEAVRIARTLDDPDTLASCLLAQHDALWTPGTASARAAIAAEIGEQADRAGDRERRAQALLLSATAQLENGSPAFRATFAEYTYLTERLRQPRHDYLLLTRRAALALLDGDIDDGDRLSAEAASLGEALGERDAGNVRMSQRLEVARARSDPAELRELAADAVRWWIGVPAHAHAVAAGFHARAGDLDAARTELDTVLELDEWYTDHSYLWSVFIGEMAAAAIALDDRPLCRRLLHDLLPLADTCAVNAALVCFMGAHAHRIGLLHAALGESEPADRSLRRALLVHRRLGARAWLAETHQALASHGGANAPEQARRADALRADLRLPPHPAVPPTDAGAARLRRVGDMWEASYQGHTAYLRDSKGLRDIALLMDRPGTDVSSLSLTGGGIPGRERTSGTDPVLDRTALLSYRRRLAELEDDLASAQADSDLAGQRRITDEREQLLTELRHATRPGGSPRPLGSTAAERARKAVTARIRDAIRRIGDAHPDLGAHLDRTVRTGTTCRYEASQPAQ